MIYRLIIFALIPWLTACFEQREEVWIETDGSGRMEVTASFPARVLGPMGGKEKLQREIEQAMGEVDELQLDALEIDVAGDEVTLHLKASAESMLDLLDLTKEGSDALTSLPPSAKHFMGDVEVKLDGTDVTMSRVMNLKHGFGLAALGIGRDDRENKHVTYVVHLPIEATDHNATRTENGARTLIWEHTLGEALTAPIELRFRTPLPIPWIMIALVAVGLIALVVGFIWWRRKRRRKRNA